MKLSTRLALRHPAHARGPQGRTANLARVVPQGLAHALKAPGKLVGSQPVSQVGQQLAVANLPVHLDDGVDDLTDSERKRAWSEIEEAIGQFEGPSGVEVSGEVLVAAGTK